MSALNIASEVSGAGAALAGLILVFFGAALSSFDTYTTEQKNAVRGAYRWRAWPAFVAFVLSLGSCGLALVAKSAASENLAWWAAVLLAVAGIGILVSAFRAVSDIG